MHKSNLFLPICCMWTICSVCPLYCVNGSHSVYPLCCVWPTSFVCPVFCVCRCFCMYPLWWLWPTSFVCLVSCMLPMCRVLHMKLILHVPHMVLVLHTLFLPRMVCVPCILSSNSLRWSDKSDFSLLLVLVVSLFPYTQYYTFMLLHTNTSNCFQNDAFTGKK
jgi:hypothetical protein